MSDSKLSPLEAVQRYHKRYVEYEAAFNKKPFTDKDIEKDVLNIVGSDIDVNSDEFIEKMFSTIDEKTKKREDVNNAAYKFFMYADFYIMTQEKELPENILKDYNNLPIKDAMKHFYSVKDGEFVQNEKIEISPERAQYFREVYKQVKLQLGNS